MKLYDIYFIFIRLLFLAFFSIGGRIIIIMI